MTVVVHALVLINIDSNMHGDEIKTKTTCKFELDSGPGRADSTIKFN